MPEVPNPGPTPSGYQRTTGGQFHWVVPSIEDIREDFPQYEIHGLQGQGGMGAVFRARQKSLDRLVAIKVLPHGTGDDTFNFAERFKNEARTMARLNHPGIVHVHDFGETTDGLLYIVMEFVEGTDVQQLLLQQRLLPPSYALPIAAHVCDALGYAHTNGVIHRDIKPANVMLTREGAVKVADFGLAKLDDPAAASLTQTNMTMGTPDYVAPEAMTGDGIADSRADLYAVGVMIYHMLVGEVPRGMFDMPSVRIPGLDPRIDAVIARAMKQLPEQRYQTAAQLRADLDAILTTPIVQAGGIVSAAIPRQVVDGTLPPTSEVKASTPKSVRRWPLFAVAAAMVVMSALWLQRRPASEIPAPASDPSKTDLPTPAQPTPTPTLQSRLKLDDAKWLPFSYPGDFGKIDGGVEVASDGSLHIFGGYGQRLRTTWQHQDIAVRTHLQLATDSIGLIGLRTDMNKEALRVAVHPDRIDIVSEIKEDTLADDQTVLRSFPGASAAFYAQDGAWLTFAVLGSECSLWIGDQFLGHVETTLTQTGKVLFDGENAIYRDMQWQVIGDGPAPEPRSQPTVITLTPGDWAAVRFPDDKPDKGTWEKGILAIPIRDYCRLPEVYHARDAALRAKVTVKSGDGSYKGLYFKLRNDNAIGFFNLSNPRTAHVGIQPDQSKDLITLGNSAPDSFPLGKQDLLVEFAAVGDQLILAIDGKTVTTAHSSTPAVGKRADSPYRALIQAGFNTALLRDLEFMSLDGVPKDKHPEFIRQAATFRPAEPAKPTTTVTPPVATPTPTAPISPELKALQATYATAIAKRVTAPHEVSMAQLRNGYLAALDRAVTARQLTAAAIQADKDAIAAKAALPPDIETTPDALSTLRTTYRTKASEYDDARTTAHLALLTPYVAKLRELEAELTQKARPADAGTVKAYREALSENPLALPEPAKP